MKITKRQLTSIIWEECQRLTEERDDDQAFFNLELIDAAKKGMPAFDSVIAWSRVAGIPDVAEDLADIRDTVARELSIGQPASQDLRGAIDLLRRYSSQVVDSIPDAIYYWVFPEEME